MNGFMVFILFFAVLGALEATFSMEKIKEASKKCCTPNRQECCIDIIKFGTPIRCGYENHRKFPEIVHDCLQKELFAEEPEKMISLNDSGCCRIFGEDRNDPNRRCEKICKDTMTSPSLDADTKMSRIRECSITENVLFKCFENCRNRQRQGENAGVLRTEDYCNSTWIQKRPIRRV